MSIEYLTKNQKNLKKYNILKNKYILNELKQQIQKNQKLVQLKANNKKKLRHQKTFKNFYIIKKIHQNYKNLCNPISTPKKTLKIRKNLLQIFE